MRSRTVATNLTGHAPYPHTTIGTSPSGGVAVAVAILAMATTIAFADVLRNGLVNWDDYPNLVQNDAYRGFDAEHLRWMFTTAHGGHYQPLSWFTFAIDDRVWGGQAVGFHLTNLLLHLATAIGFFFVTKRLLSAVVGPAGDEATACGETGREAEGEPEFPARGRGGPRSTLLGMNATVLGALSAALLFAVHPLRVESVAWATERRDVLSGAWLMIALLFYLRAVDRSGPKHHRTALAWSLLFYVLSLLSKATGMTFPLALLLLDAYPLRRFTRRSSSDRKRVFRRILIEKLLFASPAIAVAAAAVWAQSRTGALWSLQAHPMSLRIGQAFYGIVFYAGKSLWPFHLITLYEQSPSASALDSANVAAALFALGLTVILWRARRRGPARLVAWAVYVVMLSPMLGLAQSGQQVVADRYSYIPCMSGAALLGGGAAALFTGAFRRVRIARILFTPGLLVLVAFLVTQTRQQTQIWFDSFTLWTAVLESAPDTPTAHINLAVILNERGEHRKALEHSRRGLAVLPGNRAGHIALARASMAMNDPAGAYEHFRMALQISRDLGKRDAATMVDLALAATRLDRFDEAERIYREVMRLEPTVAEWPYNLAGFLASRSRYEEAAPLLQDSLRLNPNLTAAYLRSSVVWSKLGDPRRAKASLEDGLRRAPSDQAMRTQLAWILATCRIDDIRDGPRALRLARSVLQDAHGKGARANETLAAALAETGDFEGASAVLRKLLSNPRTPLSDAKRLDLESMLTTYRNLRPTRE